MFEEAVVCEHRTFSYPGASIRYAVDRVEPTTEGTAAVVCVHGITRNRHDFRFLLSRLGEKFVTYAPDLIGHGDSEWMGDRIIYRKELFLAQLDHLFSNEKRKKIGYVGTSYGGLLGILLAAEKNVKIDCLVLNDTGPGIDPELFKKMAKAISYYPTFRSVRSAETWIRTAMRNGGEMSEDIFAHLTRHGVREVAPNEYTLAYDRALPKLYTESGQEPSDIWDVWEKVTCPVLVVHGTHSEVLTSRMIDRMKEIHPSIDVLEVPDAGHFPHLMNKCQAELVEQWIACHLKDD